MGERRVCDRDGIKKEKSKGGIETEIERYIDRMKERERVGKVGVIKRRMGERKKKEKDKEEGCVRVEERQKERESEGESKSD